jgi:hypothetical protein
MFKFAKFLEEEDKVERGKYGVREEEWDISRPRKI